MILLLRESEVDDADRYADRNTKVENCLPRQSAEVEIRIFAPERAEKSWTCRYEIAWPERLKTMTVHGFDSVQALELTLRLIGVELYTSPHHQSGELIFGTRQRPRIPGYAEFA